MSDPDTLIEAIREAAAARVSQLLEESPDLAAARDAQGTPVLMLALYHGQPEIAEQLAASRTAFSIHELAALGRAAELAAALDEESEALDGPAGDGFRPLGLACFFGREAAVELLLARGADPNLAADNPMRVAAIHSAVAFRDPDVALRIAGLLLEHGARPDAQQHGGWTALHSAAMHGHLDLVRLLVEHGAATDLESEDGRTARAMASDEGHLEVARLLAG